MKNITMQTEMPESLRLIETRSAYEALIVERGSYEGFDPDYLASEGFVPPFVEPVIKSVPQEFNFD
ncbi:hypothetical protein J4429_00875 [Candidatus Pacearchaeota archaeon]|nr:hypothetical protein [Candidatus Pacearchaeota archaeon]